MTLSFAGQNHKWNKAEDAAPVVKAIQETKELTCLKLEANTLGVEAAKVIGDALAGHPEFERAHWKDLFTGRLKTEIPQALKHLFSGLVRAGAKLKELDLSDNALGPVGVEGMVEFMSSPVCYSLEELRLNNNGLGIKGGTMLCNSLKKLVENAKAAGTPLKLKVFISGRNRLEKEGAKVFSELFSSIGTLEEVAMPQNGIFHEGIAALAKSFSNNPSLRIINLNDNTFTPKGAKAMADQLCHMENLEIINFGDCLLKTRGAFSIAEAIKENHTKLKELHLDSNEILVDGGLAIVDAVQNKENLEILMLDVNQFGEEGADWIMEAAKKIGKADVLLPMEENEEPDSEEEDEDDDEEDEDDDDDSSDSGGDSHDEVVEVPKGDSANSSRTNSVVSPVICTVEDFCDQPSAARLLGLGDVPADKLLEEAKKRSADDTNESLVISCIDLLMRTSSVAASSNDQVQDIVRHVTTELAKMAFNVAQNNNITATATNTLLVYLGLIKSEDKKFKIEWDLKSCLKVLANIIPESFIPKDTKDTIQLFLQKSHPSIDQFGEERHQLMKSLFK